MGEALAEALALAVAVAVSPPPVVAMVLVLTTPRGRANGAAFVVGWLTGLTLIGVVVLLLVGSTDQGSDGDPAWRDWLELALGVLLLGLAVRYLRKRPMGDEPTEGPAWMQRIDSLGTGGAMGLGLVLTVANPKNLLLAVAAAGVVGTTDLSTGQQFLAYLVFVVVASAGVVTPMALVLLAGERAPALLAALRGWLTRHNAVIMAVVCAVLGGVLVSSGLPALTG